MKKKILIVDDIFTNRFLLKHCFDDDYEIYEAENGKEAIDLIKNNSFNLVFMDIEMPIMNGYDTIKLIRSDIDKEIPIVIITAYSIEDIGKHIDDTKYNDIMNKPISIQKIGKLTDKYIK